MISSWNDRDGIRQIKRVDEITPSITHIAHRISLASIDMILRDLEIGEQFGCFDNGRHEPRNGMEFNMAMQWPHP